MLPTAAPAIVLLLFKKKNIGNVQDIIHKALYD